MSVWFFKFASVMYLVHLPWKVNTPIPFTAVKDKTVNFSCLLGSRCAAYVILYNPHNGQDIIIPNFF